MNSEKYTKLLVDNPVVITYVKPDMCSGISELCDRDNVRLDIGMNMPIDAAPKPNEKGLDCRLSINRKIRNVFIPWNAVLWAGNQKDYERFQDEQQKPEKTAKIPQSKRSGEKFYDDVVYVDFVAKRRIA